MPISQTEQIHLACPACGAGFEADVWTLVDAAERPDLSQALRDDALDVVACPSCGHRMAAGAPLLFHEPAGRRVYFAVPPGADEHAWRERAQQLLYALVAAIPEEQRLPYLGDVQVEHEVAGVRRALLRRERRRSSARETGGQADKQAGAAELLAPGRYRLTRLLRGQRGTEADMAAAVPAGSPAGAGRWRGCRRRRPVRRHVRGCSPVRARCRGRCNAPALPWRRHAAAGAAGFARQPAG